MIVVVEYEDETGRILIGGGTKKRQSRDIDAAREHWASYKTRKRKG